MTTHTKGPWTWGIGAIRDSHGHIAFIPDETEVPYYYSHSKNWNNNAKRIVDCVNGCEGIMNPKEIKNALKQAFKLMRRCDGEEGVQPDGSNMDTLALAVALEALRVNEDTL